MTLSSYEVVDYATASRIELIWHSLLRRRRNSAERLLKAMEEALRSALAGCTLVEPQAGGEVEVYLVPSRFALLRVPYAAALLRVDHRARTITVVDLIETYGLDEAADWTHVRQQAAKALDGERQ